MWLIWENGFNLLGSIKIGLWSNGKRSCGHVDESRFTLFQSSEFQVKKRGRWSDAYCTRLLLCLQLLQLVGSKPRKLHQLNQHKIFQDENAGIHESKSGWGEQDWPPQSPDLNPAEILWDVLEKTLHRALTFTWAVQGLDGAVDIICAKSMPQGITVGVLLVSSQPQMNCRMANLCHEEFSGLKPTFMSCYKLQPDKLYTCLKWIRTLSSLSPQFSGIKRVWRRWLGDMDELLPQVKEFKYPVFFVHG